MLRFCTLLVWTTVSLIGCDSIGQGPCEQLALTLCDECNVGSATEDTLCACLEDDEVDNADRYFNSEDDAEQWCFRTQQEVSNAYLTKEERTECRQDVDFFKEFGDDVCETWGYESGGGYDTGSSFTSTPEPTEPSVSISWPDDSTLEVTVANLDSGGFFGLAETGSGDSGWYGEDCIYGICHPVINGVNMLISVHPDVGGSGPSAVESGSTTLFNGAWHAELTYAVWDAVTEDCVYCNGEDCGYYTDYGC